MTRLAYNKNRRPAAARSLQSLSPKTIAAIALMAVMGLLWLRVLTNGSGPAAAQAAAQTTEHTAAQTAAPLKITPVALPVIAGRHDTLQDDFFSLDNWHAFHQTNTRQTTSGLSDQERLALRHKTFIEGLAGTLNLDAILHATDGAPARACIDGKVLTQGQTLTVKNTTENYELTLSEIGEHQVVLTWNDWNAVLNMTQPERVD